MRKKDSIKSLFTMLALLMLAILVLQGTVPVSGLQLGTFDSPITFDSRIVTPVAPGPTPTPPVPEETQRALNYIAEREGIPVEQLVVANQHRREYELLGRAFWAVTVLDTKGDGWYDVMVDLADGSFVDDVEAIEQAEREAHRAKYGKLEPDLFEHLKTMKSDDEVPVVIWVAGEPKRSEQELYAALAAKYPEVQAALERSGNPFDVGDRELIHETEAEYVRMLEADTQERIQPLVHYLEGQGYAVTTFGALPAMAVTLPKAAILELGERTDVGVVSLSGEKAQTEVDSAMPSDRVPAVWQGGFEGNGVYIGILEAGRVDFDSPQGHNYLNQGAVRPCGEGVSDHKTWVASAAASFHPTYTGVAPEATIVDACTEGTDTDAVAGLEWATAWADPINASISFNKDPDLDWTDRAFDHWARVGNDSVVVSTGRPNGGDHVGSPAKGWNVLAVGGSNDNNTPSWTDDSLYNNYAWKNPTSDNRDREKPEVVAPAESITVVGPNRSVVTWNGTSLAAPQVAGLAALLIDRNSYLKSTPEAVRAIIMASAVNNIHGPSGIPTGDDLLDGAGAIDAALADTTAKTRWTSATSPCTDPCWWGITIDNTNFPVDTYLYRYFRASRGERIRVAISWWSHADCRDKDHCYYDRLDTDLHLGVKDPDGQQVEDAWSASWDNNYELVDFIAPKTGKYTIAVYKERADETSNYLGIAWVKDATYLPDLRNKDGWASEFYVRNDGTLPRNVEIHYFDSSGNPTPKVSDVCYLFPNQWCWIPVYQYNRIPANTTGSAIVGGGEDVSVVVENRNGTQRYAYNGIAADATNPGWGQVGTDIHLPLLMKNNSGWYTMVTILNTGSGTASIDLDYFNQNGDLYGGPGIASLEPNASITYKQANHACPTVASGRITSDRPLAVIVRQYYSGGSGITATYNGFSAGGTTANLPLIMANNYGWYTGIAIQNLGSAATNVTVRYYPYPGFLDTATVQPNATVIFVQVGGLWGSGTWVGSARVTASDSQPIAAAVNQTTSGRMSSYSGFVNGTGLIVLLNVRNDMDGWTSGVQVQNLDSTSAQVKVRANSTETWYWIGGYKSITILPVPGIPSGSQGPATVECTNGRRIAAIVNTPGSGAGDLMMTYNGVNR